MSEDISNIRKYTNTRTQVRNLIKEFNLSRNLSVPTETLDYLRQQIDLDGMIEVTDDQGSWAGSKPLRRGYFLTFEPDYEKLNLWHKLNAPWSISIDSSFFQRNGEMHGIPLPVKGYDNGLVGSVQLATGFDGIDDYVDIPHIPECQMYKVKEGFTFHIKFAPCDIKLSNGLPVTLYSKKDTTSPSGYENAITSVLLPEGHIATKLLWNGREYNVMARDYFDPDTTEFGITKWYDHTIRFSSIQRELDLLVDNVQYNDEWLDSHLVPFPFHDTNWHIARSTYTNRGLFWGGLGDFRYYWDLFFSNQHNYNLFTNRISISNIPYGQCAVIGHSYITHSSDIGFIGGYEPPLSNGDGFITTGAHWMFKAEPVTNDIIPVYKIETYPKIESDMMLMYDVDYTPPVSNNLEIRYPILGSTTPSDGTVSNDFQIVYDLGVTTNPPPSGNWTCPIGWTYNSVTDRCDPPTGTGDGGGGTQPPPIQPEFKIGVVSDWDGGTMQTNCDNMKAHGVTQVVIPGDFSHGSSLDASIDALDSMGANIAGCNAMGAVGNHSDPDEDGNSSMWNQEISYFCFEELGSNILVKQKRVLNVYFISLCTQDTNMDSQSSPQYAWCVQKLQEAAALKSSGQVKWIIVAFHKPFFAMPTDHPIDEMGAASLYNPLFQQYGVDFVFSGHNHVLQYSKPLTANNQVSGVQTTNGVWDFTKPHGVFYCEVGTGGRTSDNNPALTASYQYANDSDYGFTLLTLAPDGLNMTVQFWTENDEMLYEFKVTKSGGTTGGGSIPAGQAFKFNIAGDFRAGSDATDTANNLVSDTPNVILMLGDYAVGDATEEEWCNTVMAPVKNSNIPVWGCMGNHDNNDYLTVGFFENTSWVWSVKYGNIMFVSCDTVAESVSATQALCQAAQNNPAIMRIVPVMHESVFKQAGGGTEGSDTTIAYHNMFKTFSKIKLVIAGHSHNWTVFPEYEGIVYVICEDGGQAPDADTGAMHCTSDANGTIVCNMIPNGGSSIGSFTIPATPSTGGGGTNPPIGDPVCQTGYTWYPSVYKCIQNQQTPTCPTGQTYNPTTQRCETPPPSTGEVDPVTGIEWKVARGAIGVIEQTRDESDDKRWSGEVENIQNGYQTCAYLTLGSNASDGHIGMKLWGGHHSSDCGYEESGSCCCWYDLGLRSNGDVSVQNERPHPNNNSFDLGIVLDNIGRGIGNATTGVQWLVKPVIPGGSADNGGIELKMWVDTSGLSGGRPQNNWVLVIDYIDNGAILGDYVTPSMNDVEMRQSGGTVTSDMGGLHWRKC